MDNRHEDGRTELERRIDRTWQVAYWRDAEEVVEAFLLNRGLMKKQSQEMLMKPFSRLNSIS